MSGTFRIQLPPNVNSATLDANGRAEVTFTVYNENDAAITGRSQIVHEPGAPTKDWVNVAGAGELEYSPRGTQQVRVQVAVKKGAPVGKYRFRLAVFDVKNTRDNYSESLPVEFEVKEVKEEPTRFPWWIVAAVAGVLLVGGFGTWWLLRPKEKEVPNVVGMEQAAALQKIQEAGFVGKVGPTVETAQPAPGKIKDQSPEAGSKHEPGMEVILTIAAAVTAPVGEVNVPSLAGYKYDVAMLALHGAGLKPKEVPVDRKKIARGLVYETKPPAGARVKKGSEVEVIYERALTFNVDTRVRKFGGKD